MVVTDGPPTARSCAIGGTQAHHPAPDGTTRPDDVDAEGPLLCSKPRFKPASNLTSEGQQGFDIRMSGVM
jgi:hypothetical protein